jgi:hypothetical protein
MKKLLIGILAMGMVSCSSLDVNFMGTTNKVTVIKSNSQKNTKDTNAENSGSKVDDALKGINQKAGEIDATKPNSGE